MIYAGFIIVYALTVVGFLYVLNQQGNKFIDAASDQSAREMAERNALLERIQRPHQQPTPPNVMPLHPMSTFEDAGPPVEQPTDELYLAGTIDRATSRVSDNEPAA